MRIPSVPLFVLISFSGPIASGCGEASGDSGTRASGGATTASGGSTAMGGKTTTNSGTGSANVGGATASGGKSAVGGAKPTGGSPAVGGATAKGGTVGTGGTSGSAGSRPACAAPAGYRNLFVEILGKTQADVDTKLSKAVQQLFHGTGSDQPIYYEMGTDQAYIMDINNNDVRSEGMSYGMFVAVEMDMKTEFDKLWKYAATRMRQSTGLFAWQMNKDGSVKSPYAAPDGEEYFAMALMLASRRWGSSTGTDYAGEAKKVMNAMVTQGDFSKNPAVVTFGPNQSFSDASYVLPLFYSEWACFDTANASFWNSATTYARTFFQKATDATTGLAPDKSNFDGTPYQNSTYASDAWRVPMNIMMDHYLNNADAWQATYAQRMAAFWTKEGLTNYGNAYTLSGSKTQNGHGAGQVGANAMLAFGLPVADAKPFLQAAWDAATPTGQYRYYDGCLYMLSMLYLTGKFSLFY